MTTGDKFFNVFSGWFNGDLVNVDNPQEVEDAADSCAADLVRNIPDIDATIVMLTDMLDDLTPALIGRFMRVTTVDWLWDKETEQILRRAIELIIADLPYYQGRSEAFQPSETS